MFNISLSKANEFRKIYENHMFNVTTCNIFFHHIKLIAHRPTLLSRDEFHEHYNIFSDIKLETPPIDTFVEIEEDKIKEFKEKTEEKLSNMDEDEINDDIMDDVINNIPHIIEINRLCPEFGRIEDRITFEDIKKNFPENHRVVNAIIEHPERLDEFVCDCFIHWCIDKYLDNIANIRLAMISNYSPIIEYLVDNISLEDMNKFLSTTKRVNEEKIKTKSEDAFFGPDFSFIVKFYKEEDLHGIDNFDVDKLMQRLISNQTLKSDIYIIIAIYMLLTYCRASISSNDGKDEKCVAYVKDVISKL